MDRCARYVYSQVKPYGKDLVDDPDAGRFKMLFSDCMYWEITEVETTEQLDATPAKRHRSMHGQRRRAVDGQVRV
jgi:hypothetical protein